tara:strand:- start:1721 stop:1954 length:234 start_codon:yes stop_codon:yes gene_type:complete
MDAGGINVSGFFSNNISPVATSINIAALALVSIDAPSRGNKRVEVNVIKNTKYNGRNLGIISSTSVFKLDFSFFHCF